MAVNKNFVVKNGLEVDSNLIVADATTNKVGVGTTVPLKEIDVRGDVSVSGVTTTSNLSVTGVTTTQQVLVSGISTFVGFSTFNDYIFVQDGLNVAGVTTSNSYAIDGTTVINGSRELQNIASLDATTTATIEAAISNAPNTFTDLLVSGVSSFVGDATFGNGIHVTSGVSTFSGIGTFASDVFVNGDLTVDGALVYATASATNINVTGIATVGTTLDVNGDADFDGHTELDNISVSGFSTFVGFSTFNDYVFIQDGLNVTGVTTSNALEITGVSTFTGDIDANGSIDVDGHTELDNLNVSGVSTFAGITTHTASLFGTQLSLSGVVTAAGGFNIGIQSAGVDIATGVVTALNFGGTGNNIDYNAGTKTVSISIAGGGGGGLGTAIGADYPESNIFVTPETLFVGAGSTLEIDASADDGNVAFMRENNIVVGSGATIEITPGTEVRLDVLGVFSEPAIGATTRASFDSIIVSGLSTFTGLAAANGGLNVTGTLNANSGLNASGVSTFTNIFHTGIATFGSSNGIGTVTVGVGTTALLVDGNARVTGILTVGTASVTIDGLNSKITVGTAVTVDSTGINLSQTTTGIALPQGTTAQRPSGNIPYLRWNTTNSALEFYNGTDWVEIISDYFPSGSTILG